MDDHIKQLEEKAKSAPIQLFQRKSKITPYTGVLKTLKKKGYSNRAVADWFKDQNIHITYAMIANYYSRLKK